MRYIVGVMGPAKARKKDIDNARLVGELISRALEGEPGRQAASARFGHKDKREELSRSPVHARRGSSRALAVDDERPFGPLWWPGEFITRPFSRGQFTSGQDWDSELRAHK